MRSGFALAILLLSGLAATRWLPSLRPELASCCPSTRWTACAAATCRAWPCVGKDLWAVSDRDDDQIYRLDTRARHLAGRDGNDQRAAGARRVWPAVGLAHARKAISGVGDSRRRSGF
jgi:hypothetical protein